jgi:hypothetical protein
MAEGLYGFTPNISGIRTVFRSGGMQDALRDVVEPIADNANGLRQDEKAEYRTYVDLGQYTAIGKVVCGNQAARRDNARNNTILKAR